MVMKNWLPLVLGPALALDSRPASGLSAKYRTEEDLTVMFDLEVFVVELSSSQVQV